MQISLIQISPRLPNRSKFLLQFTRRNKPRLPGDEAAEAAVLPNRRCPSSINSTLQRSNGISLPPTTQTTSKLSKCSSWWCCLLFWPSLLPLPGPGLYPTLWHTPLPLSVTPWCPPLSPTNPE